MAGVKKTKRLLGSKQSNAKVRKRHQSYIHFTMVAKINRDLKLKRKISVEVIIIAVEIHPFEEIRHHDIITLSRSGGTITVLWATILGAIGSLK